MNKLEIYSGRRFRSAIRAFILGRSAQGIANIVLTIWTVRLLASMDYGAYMAIWGMVEMLVPLSSLGLLESVRRFLPDLATRGSREAVHAFVKWTTIARFVILIAWSIGIAVAWHALTGWLSFDSNQTEQTRFAIALVAMVLGYRYACEMLETMLEQRWSQLVHAIMPLGRLIGVAVLVSTDRLSLASVLWVDLTVSILCLVLAEAALAFRLRRLNTSGTHRVRVREVVVFAWHMSGVNLLQAFAGIGALRLLAARVLGLEAAGLYAFLQQLVNVFTRFMPAQLMANIIRPMLIARRVAGDSETVEHGLGIMWKSNLFIVIACIVVFAVGGDVLIDLVSGGRFKEAGLIMLALLLSMGGTSQGQLINMAMQIHDQTRELRSLSLLFLLLPLAAWLGGQTGLMGFAMGIVVAQWLRNFVALWLMRRIGVAIHIDTAGLIRLVGTAGMAAILAWWISGWAGAWAGIAICMPLLAAAFLIAKPLSQNDAVLLAKVLKGRAQYLNSFVYSK